MSKYEKFYKEVGIRKIAHFLNPMVVLADTFEFPRNSLLYWNKPTNIIEPFTNELGFLKNEKRVYVDVKIDYPEGTIGSFSNRVNNANTIISDIKKDEKSFKYLKPGQKNISISSKFLLTFHYGAITYAHKYSANPLSEYHKWYNNMLTITRDLSSNVFRTDRQKILFIGLPKKLPTRIELDRFAKKITSNTMNTLITNEHLDVLELWKFLTPEYKDESLLGKISVEDMAGIDLLFYIDNKVVLLNMEILYSTIKEYNHSTKIKAYPAETMRKVFYKMLYSTITAPGLPSDEIDSKNYQDAKDIDIDEKLSETNYLNDNEEEPVDIDQMLEEEVIEKETEVKVKDTGDEDVDEEELNASEINDTLEDVETDNYNSIEEIINEEPILEDKISKETEFLRENKIITKKKADDIEAIISEQKKKPAPFKNAKVTVGEMLDPSKDDFTISEEKTKISSNKVVFMEEHNVDTLSVVKETYIKEQYEKDLLRTVYSLQNNAIVVNDYEIEEKESILGKTERHSITINALNGRPSTIKIDLPKIEEDGTFKLSGNTYKMISQRADGEFYLLMR